jgi:hypothetical protein
MSADFTVEISQNEYLAEGAETRPGWPPTSRP